MGGVALRLLSFKEIEAGGTIEYKESFVEMQRQNRLLIMFMFEHSIQTDATSMPGYADGHQ